MHGRRTVLSALGMMVGVGSIVLLISLAKGVQQDVAKQVDDLGVNLVIVLPGKISTSNPFNPMSLLGISSLTWEDAESLRSLPGIRRIATIMFVAGGAGHGPRRADMAIGFGVTPDWFQIRPLKLTEGRLLNDQDANEPVCVLSGLIRRELFGNGDALGKKVSLNRGEFTVVGVVEEDEKSSIFGSGGFEYVIYAPIRRLQAISNSQQIHRIIVQSQPDMKPELIVGSIQETMLRSHQGREDFSVVTQQQLLELTFKVLDILTVMLTGITSIALIVGGIGVMNVMLMSVSERIREIGVRKAVGATRREIFLQFLSEATLIAILGGALGVAVAMSACAFISARTALNPLVSINTILLALGVCSAVGLAFGALPAYRAALKDPVEALRNEG